MWEDKERRDAGEQRDGKVKDRDPVAIKMSVCAEADAHLPRKHTFTHTHAHTQASQFCQ